MITYGGQYVSVLGGLLGLFFFNIVGILPVLQQQFILRGWAGGVKEQEGVVKEGSGFLGVIVG